MIKQILGRLPRKPSSKSAPNDAISNDGGAAAPPSFNSSQGTNSVGPVLHNSKSSSAPGRTSNANTGAFRTNNGTSAQQSSMTNKPNGGKKSTAVASQPGPLPASSTYEALPTFRDVPSSEKQNLFIRKLNENPYCKILAPFSTPANPSSMEKAKQHTQPLQVKVLDITSVVDYQITSYKNYF